MLAHFARLARQPLGQPGCAPQVLAGAGSLLQQLLSGAAPPSEAAHHQARHYAADRSSRPAAPAVAAWHGGSSDEDESVVRLPDSMEEILALNPRLHHVMTLAQEHQK